MMNLRAFFCAKSSGIPQYWVLERQKCSAKMLRVWSSMNAGFKLLHLRVGGNTPNLEDLHTNLLQKLKLLGLLWEWWEYLGDGNTRLPNMWEWNGMDQKKQIHAWLALKWQLTRHWSLFPINFPGSCYPKRESPKRRCQMGIHHGFRGVWKRCIYTYSWLVVFPYPSEKYESSSSMGLGWHPISHIRWKIPPIRWKPFHWGK